MERVSNFSRAPVDDAEIEKGTKAYLNELEARQTLDEQRREGNKEQKKEESSKFNPAVLAKFLKGKLGVSKLMVTSTSKREPVSLFSKDSVDPYSFAQMRSNVMFEFTTARDDIEIPTTLFFKDAKVLHGFKFPEHYESVTVVTCVCTRYSNKGEGAKDLVGALNIRETYKPYETEQKDYYEMQRTMGTLPYASFEFGAGKQEERQQFALRTQYIKNAETGRRVSYHFGNPAFVASVGKINGVPDANENALHFKKDPQDCTKAELEHEAAPRPRVPEDCLWDGIIYIPGAVCKEAGLLLYDEEKAREAHLKSTNSASAGAAARKPLDGEDAIASFAGDGDEEDMGVQDMDCGSGDEECEIPLEEFEKSRFLGGVDDDNKIRCWFAVDPKHVLLWPIADTRPEVLKGAGMHVETFDIATTTAASGGGGANNKDSSSRNTTSGAAGVSRFCYLVSDVTLRGLIRSYTSSWAGKTDFRKFEDIGITIAPASKDVMGTLQNYKHLSFRVVCYFIFWKSIPPGTVLKPTLHPDMPSFQQFVETPLDKLAHDFTAKLKV